jgi:hypothetical protein
LLVPVLHLFGLLSQRLDHHLFRLALALVGAHVLVELALALRSEVADPFVRLW